MKDARRTPRQEPTGGLTRRQLFADAAGVSTLLVIPAVSSRHGTSTDDAPPPRTARPHVARTVHPTYDVPVVSYEVTDFGAKGNGITDDTGAVQAAIDAACADGGGVVFVPDGHYAIRGQLTVREGVTLRGDWRDPEAGAGSGVGTVLKAYAGRGAAGR